MIPIEVHCPLCCTLLLTTVRPEVINRDDGYPNPPAPAIGETHVTGVRCHHCPVMFSVRIFAENAAEQTE